MSRVLGGAVWSPAFTRPPRALTRFTCPGQARTPQLARLHTQTAYNPPVYFPKEPASKEINAKRLGWAGIATALGLVAFYLWNQQKVPLGNGGRKERFYVGDHLAEWNDLERWNKEQWEILTVPDPEGARVHPTLKLDDPLVQSVNAIFEKLLAAYGLEKNGKVLQVVDGDSVLSPHFLVWIFFTYV